MFNMSYVHYSVHLYVFLDFTPISPASINIEDEYGMKFVLYLDYI